MQKKLKEIANITSGHTFRKSLKNKEDSGFFVVQAQNISITRDISSETELLRVPGQGIRNPVFLEPNDILIVAKGSGSSSFKSALFTATDENTIASSSVHIIKIMDVTVLPKYVSLYVNSMDGQRSINRIVTGGSYIQSLLIKNLLELEIPIPSMHIQKSIIALHENMQAQEKILERKNKLKQNIISATFINLTK